MNIKNIIIFLLSTSAGFTGGYLFAKNKYQTQADAAISEIKEHYLKAEQPIVKEDAADNTGKEYIKPESTNENAYDEAINKTIIFKAEKEDEGCDENYAKEPYIISENDSGTLLDYDVIPLCLFKDDILADENDIRLSENEMKKWLGNNVKTFTEVNNLGGVYYVRNENMKSDFEIFTDLRNYSDLIDDTR